MKSVFGEHKQKEIPRSLQDCTKMDGVSKSLWQWAKILETIAFVLFWLNAIAGLIVGIALGADAYDDGFWLFMAGFFGGLFAGVLAYLAFFVAALLVGSLASIVENTRVSADVALFEAARAGGIVNKNEATKTGDAVEENVVATGGSVQQESARETPQKKCDVVRDVVYTCKGCGQEKLCKELRVTNENGQTRYVHYCDECLKNN